ncbi:MAG: polysaccharide biosynthesis tyrosine autokinase [bacterium]
MEYREFIEILRRRWLVILVCCILAVAVSVYTLVAHRGVYTASSKVLVRTQSGYYTGYEQLPHLTEIAALEGYRNVQTQTEILKSEEVFEATIGELKESKKLKGFKPEDVIARAIRPIPDSDVIQVTVTARDEETAVAAANALPEVYLRVSREAQRMEAHDSKVFLEEQLEKVKEQLESAEDELKEFKEVNDIADLKAESQAVVSQLVSFESRLSEKNMELKSTRSRVGSLESQLTAEEKEVVTGKTVARNPIVQDLRAALTTLEVEHARLSQNFSNRHPKMLEVNAQIREIRDKLKDAALEIVAQQQVAQNPMRRMLLEQIAILKSDEIAVEAGIVSLNQAVATIKNSLATLPDDEMMLARLTRNRDLAENLYSILEQKYQDFRVTEETRKLTGRIIERARYAAGVSRSRKLSRVATSIIVGFVFGLGMAFLLEYFDDAIYSPGDVERHLGLHVLGQIPFDKSLEKVALHCHEKPNSPASESFRGLRNRMRYLLSERGTKTLLVTSAAVEEGKSVVALNMAITLAQFGQRVLLVDGDLRRPTLHKYFGVENKGLTNSVVDGEEVTPFILETPVIDLSFLPSGPLPLLETMPVVASELIEDPKIGATFEMLRRLFDYIIVDSPPVLAVTDPLSIAAQCDGVILIIDSGATRKRDALNAKAELDAIAVPVIGAVLNKVTFEGSTYYKYLYYYYEGEKGGTKERRERQKA